MKLTKEDLINKVEAINGFLEYESKRKIDIPYSDLCEEVKEWVEELRNNEVFFTN